MTTPTPQQRLQGKVTASIEDLQRHAEELARPVKPSDVPTVGTFPVDVFPEEIQTVIAQTGHHLQFRADWIGSAILYATSVAVGNSVGAIYNGWLQLSTIYLALVGVPGSNKTAPLEFAVAPIRRVNAEQNQQYRKLREEFLTWSSLSKKQRAEEGLPVVVEQPAFKTLLVSDVTPEALALTHQNNPIGLGLFADELAGWFQNFNRYNAGSEQEFWLQNWSFSPISIVRKSSGPVQIDRPAISVGGTIQPGVLSNLAKDGRNQNGFIDRILFAFPDDQQKPYDAETAISPDIAEGYREFLDIILTLRERVEFDENGNPRTRYLGFTPEAFSELRRWKNANTDRINLTENPALKGLYAKLDAYVIRFALIVELMDWACSGLELSAIGTRSVAGAIRLTEYFRENAEKVLYLLTEQTAAERLPATQLKLYEALPDEFITADAVGIARKLEISESTAKKMLKDEKLFERLRHGKYQKR